MPFVSFCILLFFSPSVSSLRFQSDLRVQHSPTSPWKVEAGNGLPDTSPQDLYRMCFSAVANHLHENWDILDILNWCRISFMNISWTVANFSDAGISPQRGSNGTSSVERSKATKEKLRRTKSWAAIFLDQFVGLSDVTETDCTLYATYNHYH